MKIILYMIVKNEAPVIARALGSVIPFIDGWAISDTGSTDGTQEIIRSMMKAAHKPGVLKEHPWIDFATNRNLALDMARSQGDPNDYAFMLDADCYGNFDPGFHWPELTEDSYFVKIDEGNVVHHRPDLVRLGAPWKFHGVVHEYLFPIDKPKTLQMGLIPGLIIQTKHDGIRNRDPETYNRDAELLEKAIEIEKDPAMLARHQFYLGESYYNAGLPRRSIEAFRKRSQMGFLPDEVYLSLVYAGRQCEDLDWHVEAEQFYCEAIEVMPHRAEAFFNLSILHTKREKYWLAFSVISRAINLQAPNGLFIEKWIYEVGVRDQFAAMAFYVGKYKECIEQCLNLLMLHPELEMNDRQRIATNAWKSTLKLSEGPVA